MSTVWDDKTIKSRAELLVMLAIADYAADDNTAFPSIDTLAMKARCSQRAVQEMVSRLINQGKLAVTYNGSLYRTNVYKLYPCDPANPAPCGYPSSHPQEILRLSAPDPSGTVRNSHKPPSTNSQGEQLAEGIYKAYPKKVGKPLALKAIRKALKDHDGAELLHSTQAFAAMWASVKDKDYCPNPATWFHQQRFNDDPETWKPRGEKQPDWKVEELLQKELDQLDSDLQYDFDERKYPEKVARRRIVRAQLHALQAQLKGQP